MFLELREKNNRNGNSLADVLLSISDGRRIDKIHFIFVIHPCSIKHNHEMHLCKMIVAINCHCLNLYANKLL